MAEALDAGLAVRDITYIKGTAVLLDHVPDDGIEISSFETVSADKKAFAKAAAIIYACNDPFMEVPYYQRCKTELCPLPKYSASAPNAG